MRNILIAAAVLLPVSAVAAVSPALSSLSAAAGSEALVVPVETAAGSADLGGYSDMTTLGSVHVRAYSSAPPQMSVPAMVAFKAAAGKPVEIDAAALLNKHLKTTLTKTLAGKQVWISGVFDRQSVPFVALSEDGKAARFYEVEKLLTPVKDIEIGTGKFRLKVAPDLGNQRDSEIILTNQHDRSNWIVTLQEMLDAVSAAGAVVRLHGDQYGVFYYDDVQGGVVQKTRSFTFIMTDAKGEFHIFNIPDELLPANFKMHGNKSVFIEKAGSKLRLTEK